MKRTKLVFVLLVCVLMLGACTNNHSVRTNEAAEHEQQHEQGHFPNGTLITVRMLNNVLVIEGDYSSSQKEYLTFFADDINKNICLQEGESFSMEILIDECPARYCTDGHNFSSASSKYIGQHTVKVEQDYWTCYMHAYTYTCIDCFYQTIILTHSISHK